MSATPPRRGFITIPATGTIQKTNPILEAVMPSCLPIRDLVNNYHEKHHTILIKITQKEQLETHPCHEASSGV